MAQRRLDRIFTDLLDNELGDVCSSCGEAIGRGALVVVVMGSERTNPDATIPRCGRCTAPIRPSYYMLVVTLLNAVRVSPAA